MLRLTLLTTAAMYRQSSDIESTLVMNAGRLFAMMVADPAPSVVSENGAAVESESALGRML